MSPSSLSPVTDQRWLASAPTVQGPDCFSATPVTPAPHWLVAMWSVAVGIRKAGPTPQIRPAAVGCFGEKKKLWVVAPRPNWWSSPGTTPSFQTDGRMVREMTFQFSLIEKGMTG